MKNSREQFNNICKDGYSVPTAYFNLVFQLSHMMRHFFTQGIGLRHVIDYYYLLQQNIKDSEMFDVVKVLKKCGMFKFFCAILWIEKDILSLDFNTDIALPNQDAGQLVLREMLKGGILGHKYNIQGRNVMTIYAKQMLYRMRFISEFPSESVSRPFSLGWDYFRKRFGYKWK